MIVTNLSSAAERFPGAEFLFLSRVAHDEIQYSIYT